MPAGRPTTYRPEFCQVVIDCGKEGKSLTQMCAELMISKQCFAEWREKYEEFGEACQIAINFSQAWWENIGQNHIVENKDGPKVNAALYGRSMAARFPDDWRENSKVEHAGSVTVTAGKYDADV